MIFRPILALTLLSFTTVALADGLDLNLRNSSVQIQYNSQMGRNNIGKSEFHIGYLNAEGNNNLLDLGVSVKDDVGSSAPGFSAGVGMKGLVGHTAGTNETAIAIGGLLGYSPPNMSRLGIVGQFYFAPNITTFGDADRYVESVVQVEFTIVPNAAGYIGYRNIRFDLNKAPYNNTTLDEGAFVGVRLAF